MPSVGFGVHPVNLGIEILEEYCPFVMRILLLFIASLCFISPSFMFSISIRCSGGYKLIGATSTSTQNIHSGNLIHVELLCSPSLNSVKNHFFSLRGCFSFTARDMPTFVTITQY